MSCPDFWAGREHKVRFRKTENVVYLPVPAELTPEQRQHWFEQAGYWGEQEEIANRALEYAQRQRENALRMLGMLGVEQWLEG